MKVALAMERDQSIAQHFGHCPTFRLVTIENGKQAAAYDMPSPPHQPGLLPRWLHERGVNVVVAGGMGASAQKLFKQYDIGIIVGVAGDAQSVLEQLIKGELRSTDEVCHEHQHEDDCGQ